MKAGNAPWGWRAADSFRSEPIGFMLRIGKKIVWMHHLSARRRRLRHRLSHRPFHHHINGQLSISHAKSISALFAFSSQAWRFCVLIRLSNHPYISPSFHFDPIVYYRRALGGKKLTLTHAEDEDIMRDAYDDVVLLCSRNRRSKCASRKW